MLEHIISPRLFVARVAELLAPDGLVVCDVPNHNSLVGLIAILLRSATRYGGVELPHHSFSYSRTALNQLFSNEFAAVQSVAVSPRHELWGQPVALNTKLRAYYRVSELLGRPSLLVFVGTPKHLPIRTV